MGQSHLYDREMFKVSARIAHEINNSFDQIGLAYEVWCRIFCDSTEYGI